MSGIGDIAGTLGAIAPSALAGYGRGRVRGMQYQQSQAQRQQELLLRQLASQLQQDQFGEVKRHNAAVEAQNAAELAAHGKEKEAAGLDEHRKFLANLAYGPGADERLYTLSQTPGALPAFYQMLHEAGVPLPGGQLLPAETRTVSTPQPDRVETLQGPPLALPGSGVAGEGPFGIPPLQAPGAITTRRAPQAPLTREEKLPARVEGAEFPKPAKVQAEEALAGVRDQQRQKGEIDNFFAAMSFDPRLQEALAKGDLATARAHYETLRPALEERRVRAQESSANSLAGYRTAMVGEHAADRTSRENVAAADRASRESIAWGAQAIQKALLPLKQKQLRLAIQRAEKQSGHDLTDSQKARIDVLKQTLFKTATTKEGLQSKTTYLEPPEVRQQALEELNQLLAGAPAREFGGGDAETGGGGTDLSLSDREINHAAGVLDAGPAAVEQKRKTYRAAGGDALRAFEAALSEVKRRRSGKKRKR